MHSRQVSGRNLEYAVQRRLKALGYIVFRCEGSRPVDIIAIKQNRIVIIECKAGKHPSIQPKQLNHILEISKIIDAIPVLAVRKKHREIKCFNMMESCMKEIKLTELELGRL